MNFILTGQDALSRVFDRVGDSARRLHRRIDDATSGARTSVNQFTTDTTNRLAGLRRDTEAGGKAIEELGKVTRLLAPAAIPAAASLAPVAAGAGAVAVAVGVMGVAIAGQISALGDAADAQKKYDDAVSKNGAHSEQAAKAQLAYATAMAALPPETRRAAAEVGVLKDTYKGWSDSLAKDTMGPFIKGVQITNALLPKTSGLVQAASGQADRFMTILGGAINTPGLDRANDKFTAFTQRTLRSVNDELVHLLRVSETGEIGGNARRFMDWARQQGPTVAAVLRDVGTAVVHVLDAGSDVGVGLLQTIHVVTSLVSAVPPSAIAVFLQLAFAMKLLKAAGLGLVAVRSALAGFGAQLLAMRTAATAAGGGLAGLGAAIGSLPAKARFGAAALGIGALVLALHELSDNKSAVQVDELATSLNTLAATGKVTGTLKSNMDEMAESIAMVSKSASDNKLATMISDLGTWIGIAKGPGISDAKKNFEAWDKVMADNVRAGRPKIAAAQFDILRRAWLAGGGDVKRLNELTTHYHDALADQALEQQLAAQAMGIFGSAAQQTQAKLDAQKISADGLRASIMALNDVNRSAYDAQIGFEQSLDALTAAFKENGATLDLNTDAGRKNGQAMSAVAKAHDEMIAAGLAAGDSLGSLTGKSEKLRGEMMRLATDAFGGNKKKAEEYVNTLLGVPSEINTLIKAEQTQAIQGLKEVQAELQKTPNAETVTVTTLNAAAIKALEAVGFKTKTLPDGRTQVFTANGGALANIAAVRKALDNIDGKTARTYTENRILTIRETRAIYNTIGRPTKGEGGVSKYASGGTPQAGEVAMVGENGPELVVFGQAARVFDATTTRALKTGSVTAGLQAAQGLAVGMRASGGVYAAARLMASAVTAGIKDEMEIASPSKKTKALAADIGRGLIVGLTSTQAKIKSVSADLVKDIKTAFSGRKESALVAYVNRQTSALLKAAAKRDQIAATIAAAKKYAGELTASAREGAQLSNLGIEPDKVSAGTIKGGLASKLAQIKQFTRYVDMLAKRGLAKGLLRQILAMGPEAGYAYASALAGADVNTFKSINSLQTQLDSATTTLGQHGADAMYDSGKNAAKGFLTGLMSQQKELERTMENIAKAMQKALKKALGIRSPARKMIPDGVNVTRGVAVGVVQGLPHVDRAMQAVAGRMAGSVGFQASAGRPAVLAGGGTVYNVHVDVRDAMDPIAVGREFQRVLLQLGRAQGATVNLKPGG
ncbi:hypothetical protein ACF1AY_04935 [Streptomyces sp. NPDC014776]|uniref:hypothetical protein n=1 Tax=Streptomyces sp. NPDC014776 TaxID=3364909 RepID=UPI0036FE6EC7